MKKLPEHYGEGRVTCEVRDRTVLLGLNDPEHLNAFSMPVVFGLEQAVRESFAAGYRRFILFGHGSSFSSGADMPDYLATLDGIQNGSGFDRFHESERALIDLARLLRHPEVFSVAAVHGWVVGQGFETAIACDFIAADPESTFWVPETRVGWNVGMGTTHLLGRTVGLGWARRILLLGERVPAKLAEQIGLVARLSEPGAPVDAALAVHARLGEAAPRALQFQKKLLDLLPTMSLDDSREIEVITGYWLAHTSDVREAAAAFVEKRKPQFDGQ